MLSIHTKSIVHKQIYGKYVSRKTHTKPDSYIIQDEDNHDKWKIDPVKTENFKFENNANIK